MDDSIDYTRYFTIKNTGENNLEIGELNNTLYTFSNDMRWQSTYPIVIEPNEEVYFKGYGVGNTFTMTGDTTCSLKGNILSLSLGDNFEGVTSVSKEDKYVGFCRAMFYNCTQIVEAHELILPLTTIHDLTADDGLYASMFRNCTSLVTAPELPATTLASFCYQSMFRGCTSLVIAPELPATELDAECYSNMFNGCSNLNKVTMLATSVMSSSFTNWLNGVASSGTFVKISGVKLPANTIPSGWEVINIESQVEEGELD